MFIVGAENLKGGLLKTNFMTPALDLATVPALNSKLIFLQLPLQGKISKKIRNQVTNKQSGGG